MAQKYLRQLTDLLHALNIASKPDAVIETKHFFSGAALYKNKTICASLSPAGLAFKLPEAEVAALLKNGEAIPLQYFPAGHIKKGYALFPNPDLSKTRQWKKYLTKALAQI